MWEFLIGVNWSNTIQCIASVATAIIAYIALNTWKKQSRANNITNFLDALTEAVHEYLQTISQSVEILKKVQIGLKSYIPLPQDEYKNNSYAKIISYIEKAGVSDSVLLFKALERCCPSVNKIQSLLAKGQIYNFEHYNNCQNSCSMLVWQFQRLQSVAAVIGHNSMNWDNQEVQKSMDDMLTVSSGDVQKLLK